MKATIKKLFPGYLKYFKLKSRAASKKLILISAVVLIFIGFNAFTKNDNLTGTSSPENFTLPDLKYEVLATYAAPVKKEKHNEAKVNGYSLPGYPVITRYEFKDPFTVKAEKNKTDAGITLVPEVEAEYVSGYKEMIQFLKDHCKISETIPKQFRRAAIKFIIDEEGEITAAKMSHSSGNTKSDELLLEAVKKMPKWKAAENPKGIKAKQEFEFIISVINAWGGKDEC